MKCEEELETGERTGFGVMSEETGTDPRIYLQSSELEEQTDKKHKEDPLSFAGIKYEEIRIKVEPGECSNTLFTMKMEETEYVDIKEEITADDLLENNEADELTYSTHHEPTSSQFIKYGGDERDNSIYEACNEAFNEQWKYETTECAINLKCGKCEVICETKLGLKLHMSCHSQTRQIKCEMCSKTFKNKGTLGRHMTTHSQSRPFKCEMCSKAFKCKGTLVMHMKVHIEEPCRSCHICNKTFSTKANLKVHMTVHSGTRPHSCSYCARSFTAESNLKAHIRCVHIGNRPYLCEICQRAFTMKCYLKNHIISVHTKSGAFACSFCSKKYIKKCYLDAHMHSHTGDRSYACKLCEKSFQTKSGMKQHVLNVHYKT